jgi:hypothetical protein
MDILNEWMKRNTKYYDIWSNGVVIGKIADTLPRIICADGFEFNCQAKETSYCNPRKDCMWPYSSVELGFPSDRDELIDCYAQEDYKIFPYVPVKTVIELIKKHGGFESGWPNLTDMSIYDLGYEEIGTICDGIITYKKEINNHKAKVIAVDTSKYEIKAYIHYYLGRTKITKLTKQERKIFASKLIEIAGYHGDVKSEDCLDD